MQKKWVRIIGNVYLAIKIWCSVNRGKRLTSKKTSTKIGDCEIHTDKWWKIQSTLRRWRNLLGGFGDGEMTIMTLRRNLFEERTVRKNGDEKWQWCNSDEKMAIERQPCRNGKKEIVTKSRWRKYSDGETMMYKWRRINIDKARGMKTWQQRNDEKEMMTINGRRRNDDEEMLVKNRHELCAPQSERRRYDEEWWAKERGLAKEQGRTKRWSLTYEKERTIWFEVLLFLLDICLYYLSGGKEFRAWPLLSRDWPIRLCVLQVTMNIDGWSSTPILVVVQLTLLHILDFRIVFSWALQVISMTSPIETEPIFERLTLDWRSWTDRRKRYVVIQLPLMEH